MSLFAESDRAGGWRTRKVTGGAVIATATHDRVAGGLCMPHSPRWHEGRLWVLDSGHGRLLAIDVQSATRDVVCELDGYTRGLAVVGNTAVVGLSKARERHIFSELPLADRCASLHCGLALVDLERGRPFAMLELDGAVTELFDVCFVPGARRVNLLRPDSPAARTALSTSAGSYWLRPQSRRD